MIGERLFRIGLALVAVALATPVLARAPAIDSHYTLLDGPTCREVEPSDDRRGDWILYRCDGIGGVAMWVLYQDSARMQVAFGRLDFEDYRPWSLDRDPVWPIEWRRMEGQAPFAVIMRVRRPFDDAETSASSELAVFRVWPDRSACFLGLVSDNDEARALADSSIQSNDCPTE